MTLDKRISEYISEERLLQRGDSVIAGVSGGADSVCLFLLLYLLSKEMKLSLAVVHIDHGIRGEEAGKDAQFTQKLCEKFGVPFECYNYNIPDIAKKRNIGEEEAGRIMRRVAYADYNRRHFDKKAVIALGHHRDDLVETMLMSLIRGSGLRGLAGIRPRMVYDIGGEEITVIRPLLCAGRDEIEEWLGKSGQGFVTDSTNFSSMYARNRIRNELIPLLDRENPNFRLHVARTASVIRNASDYIEKESLKAYEYSVDGNNSLIIEKIMTFHPAIMEETVRIWLENHIKTDKDLIFTHIKAVIGLFCSPSGTQITLPGNNIAVREYDVVRFSEKNENDENTDNNRVSADYISFDKPKIGEKLEIFFGDYKFLFFSKENNAEIALKHEKSFYICVDYDKIRKICIRYIHFGDKMVISRDGKRKKLSRIFIDEKVPGSLRKRIPILLSGEDIIWITGVRDCPDYFVSDNTVHVLECHAERIINE